MENKNKVIILIVLVVIAIFSIGRNIIAPSMNRGTGDSAGTISMADVKDMPIPKRSARRSSHESWPRSPFMPKPELTKEVPKLTLTGIFWDKENPSAIIDDEIVTVNSRVGDATVLKIEKKSVTLSDGIRNFELTLEE